MITRALVCLLLVLLASACDGPGRDVLHTPAVNVFTTCDSTLASGRNGDPCKFEQECLQKTECALITADCVNGLLVFTYPGTSCNTCKDDTGCKDGQWCLKNQCVDCPKSSGCPDCPKGWTTLSRHGCPTCECGPPSECTTNDECAGGLTCTQGQLCVADCNRLDCCANICSIAGCKGAPPVGCAMKCDDPSCDYTCQASFCKCDPGTGAWVCAPSCPSPSASCTAPAL
jgi:hypothetical protein